MTQSTTSLLSSGGEFRNPSREAAYRAECLPEYRHQAGLVFRYAVFLNLLFYLSDWRFFGQPHFPFALVARTGIVAISLLALLLIRQVAAWPQLQRLCFGWSLPVIAASAVLVTPHTDAALFITVILPAIFYLVLPLSVTRALFLGLACSAATLTGYLFGGPIRPSSLGAGLAILTGNSVLALILIRTNRLQRLAWDATQTAQAANHQLQEHRQMLQSVLQAIPTPLVIVEWENGRILTANAAARRYFGENICNNTHEIQDFFEKAALIRLLRQIRKRTQVTAFETCLHCPDGSSRAVLLDVTVLAVEGVEAVLTVIIDITERKALEAHLKRLAVTDPLTGLANRSLFFTEAAAAIKRLRRETLPLTVIMFDIDHFKTVNDTRGHQTGDVVLTSLASLCREVIRGQDLAARLGGEEFALLLPETDCAGGRITVERLRQALAAMRLAELPEGITISAGVAEIWPEETTVDAALSRADRALYAAKRAGRNRVVTSSEIPPTTAGQKQ